MILLTVVLFGTRKGAAAGAIGAGLSDLLGGFAYWVLPTILIKCMWALVLGAILRRAGKGRKGAFLAGAVAGGGAAACGLYGNPRISVWNVHSCGGDTGAGAADRSWGCAEPGYLSGAGEIRAGGAAEDAGRISPSGKLRKKEKALRLLRYKLDIIFRHFGNPRQGIDMDALFIQFGAAGLEGLLDQDAQAGYGGMDFAQKPQRSGGGLPVGEEIVNDQHMVISFTCSVESVSS